MGILTATGSIRSEANPFTGISFFEFRGRLHCDVFIEAITKHWTLTPTPHSIWDFKGADLSELTIDAWQKIAAVETHFTKLRGSCPRSVLVAKNEVDFLLLRLYADLMEMKKSPVDYKIVYDRNLAVQYLLDRQYISEYGFEIV